MPEGSNPIQIVEKLQIPRKPSDGTTPTTTDQPNGTLITNGTNTKRKRSLDDADDEHLKSGKRGKVVEASKENGPVVLDDSGNGAIVIEDD